MVRGRMTSPSPRQLQEAQGETTHVRAGRHGRWDHQLDPSVERRDTEAVTRGGGGQSTAGTEAGVARHSGAWSDFRTGGDDLAVGARRARENAPVTGGD